MKNAAPSHTVREAVIFSLILLLTFAGCKRVPPSDSMASNSAAPSAQAPGMPRLADSAGSQAGMNTGGSQPEESRSPSSEAGVPGVVKLKYADAKAKLAGAGFTNIVAVALDRAPGAGEEAFTIENQSPAAGARARHYTAITLTVFGTKQESPGTMNPGKLRVPAGLPDMLEADAIARLRGAGFSDITVVGANSDTPEGKGGTVEQHFPDAGTEGDARTRISLYVFQRSDEAIVPGVRGLKVAEAKLQIEGAKFRTALQVFADAPPDKASEFTVQAQSHPNGSKLRQGETVTLSIYPAFGAPTGDMPRTTGVTLHQATPPPPPVAPPPDKPVVVVPPNHSGVVGGTFKGEVTLVSATVNGVSHPNGGPCPSSFTIVQAPDGGWGLNINTDGVTVITNKTRAHPSTLVGHWNLKANGNRLSSSTIVPNRYKEEVSIELIGNESKGTISSEFTDGVEAHSSTHTFRATRAQ